MKGRIHKVLMIILISSISILEASGQEHIIELFKNDLELADEYFNKGDYKKALALYTSLPENQQDGYELKLRIARTYFMLKEPSQTSNIYEKVNIEKLESQDLFLYAESELMKGNYSRAASLYESYLIKSPGDEVAINKIWRLDNIHYLYEDSAHVKVNVIFINSSSSDICPVAYKEGIVFLSNLEQHSTIRYYDGSSNQPFYNKLYLEDVSQKNSRLTLFAKELDMMLHSGPVSFYDGGRKMAFAKISDKKNKNKQMGIYFAALDNGKWVLTEDFPFNSSRFSNTDPAVSSNGQVLYFTSDRPGGYGRRDIYRSIKINGKWQDPENLGEFINTRYDEGYSHLTPSGNLYFASNGLPGLGGFDIFKTNIYESKHTGEVNNLGYPINSNHDDFGLTLDSLETYGYLSSNRQNGGYDDDLYQVEMDIQSYPLVVSGSIKFKENSWSDTLNLEPLKNVRIFLYDQVKLVQVLETRSDEQGNFTLEVPYYSSFSLKISGEDIGEGIVSLIVPRYRKMKGTYEIVVVRDEFKSTLKDQ